MGKGIGEVHVHVDRHVITKLLTPRYVCEEIWWPKDVRGGCGLRMRGTAVDACCRI